MKSYEQLKALKYEDFKSPKKVLCYGGGGAFASIAPSILHCNINVVGVIDANKDGFIEVSGKEIPYYSIKKAIETFGRQAIIIITIANEEVIQQVERELVQYGFQQDNIYDLNVWSWLTTESEKSYCPFLGGAINMVRWALSYCCTQTQIAGEFDSEFFVEGRPVKTSIENFLAKREYFIQESKKGRIPVYCAGCVMLSKYKEEYNDKLVEYRTSDHEYCNADCVYCTSSCSEPRKAIKVTFEERFRTYWKTFEELKYKGDVLDDNVTVDMAGGEITINPFKQVFYDCIKKFPRQRVTIYSNAFIFDEKIADILQQNGNVCLLCDLDAGTPETYIKVKGFNKFEVVKENLKKYAQYGNIQLKYIVLSGWNDTAADYKGTVELLKYLGINQLWLVPNFDVINGSDKIAIREVLFSTARFVIALEEYGMEGLISEEVWTRPYVQIIRRLRHELKELDDSNKK